MEGTQHRPVALLMARELAANMSMPMFLVDEEARLVFFNEAAQSLFGAPYGEVGPLGRGQWSQRFQPLAADGSVMPRSEMPLVIAVEECRPAHAVQSVLQGDGSRIVIDLTAIPLFSHDGVFGGAMVVFWPQPNAA